MSNSTETLTPQALAATEIGVSPARRAWRRFADNRLGRWSLWLFLALVLLSLGAELISNDRPLLVRYQGQLYTPLWQDYPETTFGGDFETPTDYLDPFIQQQLQQNGNWALFALNRYGADTINYFATQPNPAPPSAPIGWAPTSAGATCWRSCSTAFVSVPGLPWR